jgi:hypothetical protein
VGLSRTSKKNYPQIVRAAVEAVAERLKKIAESEAAEVPEETFRDPVLRALEPLVEGKVGPPFEADREMKEKEEARRRIDEKIPPGFEDRQKGERSYGDYFVWAQLLDEAEKRGRDVLFLTRDKKPDWWRKSGGDILGPRGELVRELMSRTGGRGRLYFLTPERFLSWTEALLGVKVSEGTIIDIERVESQQSGIQDAIWSVEELAVFDSLLDQSDRRVAIEQLPEGGADESYFEVLVRMCALVGSERVPFEKFLDKFQVAFPNISVRSEAKRRASCLFKLGLAQRSQDIVTLTTSGIETVSTPNRELVQALFLEKIKGGKELMIVCSEGSSVGLIRAKLRNETPPGMTQNQAILILRWLEQLQLI